MHSVVNKSTALGLPTHHGNVNNPVTLLRAGQVRPRPHRLLVEPHLVQLIRLSKNPATPALVWLIWLPTTLAPAWVIQLPTPAARRLLVSETATP